ncbi:hypothetical protein OG21DRAFT_135716 [Imleria badia]|nr:hypothetical protein OG21DRAFT_135716 [Imleria badia]
MAFTRFELCLSGWRLYDVQARPQLTVSRQQHDLIVTGQAFGARVSVRMCMRWCTWLYRWCDSLLQWLQRSVNPGSKCLPPPSSSDIKDFSTRWHPMPTPYERVEA